MKINRHVILTEYTFMLVVALVLLALQVSYLQVCLEHVVFITMCSLVKDPRYTVLSVTNTLIITIFPHLQTIRIGHMQI